jgi:hypothetical protein
MLGTAINSKCSSVVFVYLFSCEDENMNSLHAYAQTSYLSVISPFCDAVGGCWSSLNLLRISV